MDRFSVLMREIALRESQLEDEDTPGFLFYAQCRELVLRVQKQEMKAEANWCPLDVKLAVMMGEMGIEEAFNCLSKLGIACGLMDDGAGNWGVVLDVGEANIPKPEEPGEPGNMKTFFSVHKGDWRKTIHEALLQALQKIEG